MAAAVAAAVAVEGAGAVAGIECKLPPNHLQGHRSLAIHIPKALRR